MPSFIGPMWAKLMGACPPLVHFVPSQPARDHNGPRDKSWIGLLSAPLSSQWLVVSGFPKQVTFIDLCVLIIRVTSKQKTTLNSNFKGWIQDFEKGCFKKGGDSHIYKTKIKCLSLIVTNRHDCKKAPYPPVISLCLCFFYECPFAGQSCKLHVYLRDSMTCVI